MNVDKNQLKANVYHLDIGGMNGSWVWDFGSFILFGSEEKPNRLPSNMSIYSSVIGEYDINKLEDEEPKFQSQVTFYVGDYITYIESDFRQATHFISPDLKDYSIVNDNVVLENTDEKGVLLKEVDTYNKDTKVYSESELDSWIPVVQVR